MRLLITMIRILFKVAWKSFVLWWDVKRGTRCKECFGFLLYMGWNKKMGYGPCVGCETETCSNYAHKELIETT